MQPEDELTAWARRLQAGDRAGAGPLWEAYYRRLVALARQKLAGSPRREADEEDVALSAFDSFCRGAEAGRFPRLDDRDDLWRVLLTITVRKAADLRQARSRLKRGGGRVRGESAFGEPDADAGRGIEQALSDEPGPELAAEVAEQCRELLGALAAGPLRSVAVWKMEGRTNGEIAELLGCSLATVERKLALIRDAWRARGEV